jgi:hypothetical protein
MIHLFSSQFYGDNKLNIVTVTFGKQIDHKHSSEFCVIFFSS